MEICIHQPVCNCINVFFTKVLAETSVYFVQNYNARNSIILIDVDTFQHRCTKFSSKSTTVIGQASRANIYITSCCKCVTISPLLVTVTPPPLVTTSLFINTQHHITRKRYTNTGGYDMLEGKKM